MCWTGKYCCWKYIDPWIKRDSTPEEHLGVKGFNDWLKSQLFIMIGKDPWIRVNYLSFIEGKGFRKTFTVVHKMPLYVLIYYKIYFVWYDKNSNFADELTTLFIHIAKLSNIQQTKIILVTPKCGTVPILR